MTKERIPERLSLVGNQTFGVTDFKAGSTMESMAEWDSLKHLQLLGNLESEFGLQIQMEDAIRMISFDAILLILSENMENSK